MSTTRKGRDQISRVPHPHARFPQNPLCVPQHNHEYRRKRAISARYSLSLLLCPAEDLLALFLNHLSSPSWRNLVPSSRAEEQIRHGENSLRRHCLSGDGADRTASDRSGFCDWRERLLAKERREAWHVRCQKRQYQAAFLAEQGKIQRLKATWGS